MTTLARKAILTAGFGKYSTAFGSSSGDKVTKMVDDDMEAAAEYGFDCKLVHLNPANDPGMPAAVVEALQEKRWDGFAVGFGVRGLREHTPLFEDLVNAAREHAPQARLMFPTAPDGLLDAIKRVFPESCQ